MKEIIGNENEISLKLEDATVAGLLKELSSRYGEKFKKQMFDDKTGEVKFYRIVVNGRQCNNLEIKLNDGDTIEFYPAMAGG
jgi:MoaD family protein